MSSIPDIPDLQAPIEHAVAQWRKRCRLAAAQLSESFFHGAGEKLGARVDAALEADAATAAIRTYDLVSQAADEVEHAFDPDVEEDALEQLLEDARALQARVDARVAAAARAYTVAHTLATGEAP